MTIPKKVLIDFWHISPMMLEAVAIFKEEKTTIFHLSDGSYREIDNHLIRTIAVE